MKMHLGKMGNGRLRFEIGSFSHGIHPERKTFRRWIERKIRSSWGFSLGSRVFIGILRFEDGIEVHERIK